MQVATNEITAVFENNNGQLVGIAARGQQNVNVLLIPTQYITATNTTGFTATPAQISGSEYNVLALTGTLGAGAALTLPTPAQIIASNDAFAQATAAGLTVAFDLRIINESSANYAWTVTANGASTLGGGGVATIAQNTYRDYVVVVTSTTAVFNNIGTGSWS